MFWLWLGTREPGDLFWDVVAGAGLFGLLGGIVTFRPGVALVGFALVFLAARR